MRPRLLKFSSPPSSPLNYESTNGLIHLMKLEPSGFNHLLKTPPLNTAAVRTNLQLMIVLGKVQIQIIMLTFGTTVPMGPGDRGLCCHKPTLSLLFLPVQIAHTLSLNLTLLLIVLLLRFYLWHQAEMMRMGVKSIRTLGRFILHFGSLIYSSFCLGIVVSLKGCISQVFITVTKYLKYATYEENRFSQFIVLEV
jgi:hypothetical protein